MLDSCRRFVCLTTFSRLSTKGGPPDRLGLIYHRRPYSRFNLDFCFNLVGLNAADSPAVYLRQFDSVNIVSNLKDDWIPVSLLCA